MSRQAQSNLDWNLPVGAPEQDSCVQAFFNLPIEGSLEFRMRLSGVLESGH
jgi:hypothetical protein